MNEVNEARAMKSVLPYSVFVLRESEVSQGNRSAKSMMTFGEVHLSQELFR